MSHTPHELAAEFPDDTEILHELKTSDAHFARLADAYHEVNREIHRIEAMVEMSNVVLDEDQAMCEVVQRNLDAGIYRVGRLSPRHEASVGWFQGRVATAVAGSTTAAT